jgi:RNase P subunit RPR2
MIINFKPHGKGLWHSDCTNHFGGIMKELKDEGDRTLMECLHCGKKGYYPHGRVGRVEVEEAE